MDIQYKTFDYAVKQADDEALTVQHFITTEKRDRIGDRMHADGMIIDGIPVVLLEHGKGYMGSEPVAKPLWIRPGTYKRNKGIEAKTQFFDDEQGVGRRLYQKTVEKYMPNWSIGYKSKKAKPFEDGGIDFIKWYLLEYSIVGVSMNPDANTKDAEPGGLYVKYIQPQMMERFVKDAGILKTCGINYTGKSIDIPYLYTENLKDTLDEINGIKEADFEKKAFYVEKTIEKEEIKAVIPYKKTPLANEGLKWDAGRQVKAATVDDLKIMCVWYDEENKESKGAYKGPHHLADAPHKCVKAGVIALAAAIMGARGGIDIPEKDMAKVKAHVEGHYKDWELGNAPWQKKGYDNYQLIKSIDSPEVTEAFLEVFAPEIYEYIKSEGEVNAECHHEKALAELTEKIDKIEATMNTLVEAVDGKFKEYRETVKEIHKAQKKQQIVLKRPVPVEAKSDDEIKVPRKVVDMIINKIQEKYLKEFRKVIGKVD